MRWRWAGDRALVAEFDDLQLERANALARALGSRLRGRPGVREAVPAARTLMLILEDDVHDAPPDILAALEETPGTEPVSGTEHVVPVVYDGPDLEAVARAAGLGRDDVVSVHAGASYRVAFLGFAPGFAYLLGLPDRLHVPRLETPRARVEAGSVGIADRFAGVYPHAGPGGWRIIGRTDLDLFDPARAEPALLRPGDRVRFDPR